MPIPLFEKKEFRLRRTMLFLPGGNERFLLKAIKSEADALILDLEDSVAPEKKPEVRMEVCGKLKSIDFKGKEKVVRINSLATDFGFEDISIVMQGRPDALLVPKIESAMDIQSLSEIILQFEKRYGLIIGKTKIIALIETPSGVLHVEEIAKASLRMEGLLFGAGDYAKETRCAITRERIELQFPLVMIVLAARAANIDSIDSPFFDIKDLEGLKNNALQAKQLGYDGKALIHPSQVEVVNKIFTPTSDEIEYAQKVIEVYEKGIAIGKGATTLDGKLIENVHVTMARRVLSVAKKIGLIY